MSPLFDNPDVPANDQTMLEIDDGTGLRVVSARFVSESKFDWDVFDGYDSLRVLTYSVSVDAIVRMLDRYSFSSFECVFGYEGILRDIPERRGRRYARSDHGAQRRAPSEHP